MWEGKTSRWILIYLRITTISTLHQTKLSIKLSHLVTGTADNLQQWAILPKPFSVCNVFIFYYIITFITCGNFRDPVPEFWHILNNGPFIMNASSQVKKAHVSVGYCPLNGSKVYAIVPFSRLTGGHPSVLK